MRRLHAASTRRDAGMVWPASTATQTPMKAQKRIPDPDAGAPFDAKAAVVIAAVASIVVITTLMTSSSPDSSALLMLSLLASCVPNMQILGKSPKLLV